MNKRILHLFNEAGFHQPEMERMGIEYKFEKFAELIVRECAKSANDWYQNHDKIHSDPMSYVLAHFGVEE